MSEILCSELLTEHRAPQPSLCFSNANAPTTLNPAAPSPPGWPTIPFSLPRCVHSAFLFQAHNGTAGNQHTAAGRQCDDYHDAFPLQLFSSLIPNHDEHAHRADAQVLSLRHPGRGLAYVLVPLFSSTAAANIPGVQTLSVSRPPTAVSRAELRCNGAGAGTRPWELEGANPSPPPYGRSAGQIGGSSLPSLGAHLEGLLRTQDPGPRCITHIFPSTKFTCSIPCRASEWIWYSPRRSAVIEIYRPCISGTPRSNHLFARRYNLYQD